MNEYVRIGRDHSRKRLILSRFSLEELANLIGSDKLVNLVKSRKEKYADLADRKELAELTGKQELAYLFSKEDLVDEIVGLSGGASDKSPSIDAIDKAIRSSKETEAKQVEVEKARLSVDMAERAIINLAGIRLISNGFKIERLRILQNHLQKHVSDLIGEDLPGIDEKTRLEADLGYARFLLTMTTIQRPEERTARVVASAVPETPSIEGNTVAQDADSKDDSIGESIDMFHGFSDTAIAKVALVELATLAFEAFDVKQLGVVAGYPDVYQTERSGIPTNDEKLAVTNEQSDYAATIDGFDTREFKRLQESADVAKHLPLATLIQYAFPVTMTEKDAEADSKPRAFPDVYKLQLARTALKWPEEESVGATVANVVSSVVSSLIPFNKPEADSQPESNVYGRGVLDVSVRARRKGVDLDVAEVEVDQLARSQLIEQALGHDPGRGDDVAVELTSDARDMLGRLYSDAAKEFDPVGRFTREELARVTVSRFSSQIDVSGKLVTTMMFGELGTLEAGVPGVRMERGKLGSVKRKLTEAVILPKAIFVFLLAVVVWLGCRFTVDVNMTSIHGLYRDRLASAFLVGQDTKGDVDIEEDIDLEDICRYEARSIARYHLVNVALNLLGSRDIGIRDRNSDFFIFSKRFVGGDRTGYCRSETLEQVFPQMSLATAMAISAAAASPNMGRGTSPPLVAFMTLLNIRLGYWISNPGLLEEQQDKESWRQRLKDAKRANQKEASRERDEAAKRASRPLGFTFDEVFAQELDEIERRWCQVDQDASRRRCEGQPGRTVDHGLVGIGFSGGGIRSAAINLGITQVLQKQYVFEHVDYMSSVSGGGYLASSISTLMRSRTRLLSETAGTVDLYSEKLASEIAGTVSIHDDASGRVVVITPVGSGEDERTYRFSAEAMLAVKDGDKVTAGQMLIRHRIGRARAANGTETDTNSDQEQTHHAGDQVVTVTPVGHGKTRTYRFAADATLNVTDRENIGAGKPLLTPRSEVGASDIAGTVSAERTATGEQVIRIQGSQRDEQREYRFSRFERLVVKTGDSVKRGQPLVEHINSLSSRFRWRVRPNAFLREMCSKLDEKHRWVNLSDGGHIENLATTELLRRRCKYIFIGDGEADPDLHFNGLATLIRFARIDLGIEIDIDVEPLTLDEDGCSGVHFAVGRITYPASREGGEEETGYLVYLKSSFTGDEDAVIKEYRHRNPTFPHQSTADQFFDEGQFEAYRALGQHIAEQVFAAAAQDEAAMKKPVRRTTRKKTAGTTSIKTTKPTTDAGKMSFADLEKWFATLWDQEERRRESSDSESDA